VVGFGSCDLQSGRRTIKRLVHIALLDNNAVPKMKKKGLKGYKKYTF